MRDNHDKLEFFLSLINQGADVNHNTYMLVRTCSLDLVEKLMIELGNSKKHVQQQALSALQYVQTLLQKSDFTANSLTQGREDVLSGFLQAYLLRVLIKINNTLSESKVSVSKNGAKSIELHLKMVNGLNEIISHIGTKAHLMMSQVCMCLIC
jgi:methyl coenzyme M reductase subunit C